MTENTRTLSSNKHCITDFASDDQYFLPSNVDSFLGNEYRSSLKCFHLNVRSARNKSDEINLLFDQFGFSFDEIKLSETWFPEPSEVVKLPSYNTYFLNRTASRGGGVALLLKVTISGKILIDYSSAHKDHEFFSFLIGQNIIAVCYCPPGGSLTSFFTYLESLLDFANDNK